MVMKKEKRSREEEDVEGGGATSDDEEVVSKKSKKAKKSKSNKKKSRQLDNDIAIDDGNDTEATSSKEESRAAKKAAKKALKEEMQSKIPKVDDDGIPYNKIQIRRMMRRVKHGLGEYCSGVILCIYVYIYAVDVCDRHCSFVSCANICIDVLTNIPYIFCFFYLIQLPYQLKRRRMRYVHEQNENELKKICYMPNRQTMQTRKKIRRLMMVVRLKMNTLLKI